MTMPQIQLSEQDQATLELVHDMGVNAASRAMGGSESADALMQWATASLPADQANALIARMSDPRTAEGAAAELCQLHAEAQYNATLRESANAGGYTDPAEIKDAMQAAAAGDALATRRLKQTPLVLIDQAMGIPAPHRGGMSTI